MVKRIFDIVLSFVGLVVFSPLLVLVGLLIKLTSPGPIIFGHERAGRDFQSIRVLKFRTMVQDASKRGGPLTLGGRDPRITWVGHWLRKSKVDELPQLFNVLNGTMSFVGPRPEAWKYVNMFETEFKEVLTVRPGITDFASLKFRNEGELLSAAEDPESEYIHQILPEKIRLAQAYIREQSIVVDIRIIAATIGSILLDRIRRPSLVSNEKK